MDTSYPLWKLSPFFSKKIWGWEKWLFSTHPNGHVRVANGPYQGQTLLTAWQQLHNQLPLSSRGNSLTTAIPPVLIKIIQAEQALSVQVHPDDAYAQRHGQSRGKSECWLFLDHAPHAKVVRGLAKPMRTHNPAKPHDTHDIRKLFTDADSATLEENLESLEVERESALYLPAGTIHAIGAGVKLLEVQQSSDITYRLYDYGRGRETHLDPALAVIQRTANGVYYDPIAARQIQTPYFHINQTTLHPHGRKPITFTPPTAHQQTILVVLSGKLRIQQNPTPSDSTSPPLMAQADDCLYAPLGGEFEIVNLEEAATYVEILAFSED